MKNKAEKFRVGFVLLVIVVFIFIPLQGEAAAKVVRIGCVDIENFLEIDTNGKASGYGVEYLEEIGGYTGWEYSYLQGTWSECLQWLKEGKIDILLPAEYSEERSKEYLFSDMECCLDYTALLGRKSDESYYYEDFAAFDGITVGMIKDNFLNGAFEEYAKEKGFSFQSVYYDTGTEMTVALEQEEVDAIVNGNMEYMDSQKLLAKINYMPAYFMTSIQNEGLMEELNEALHLIFINNPYYAANLHAKYYDSIERQSIGYTREESAFIQRAEPITVLIQKNNYPMEWYEEETKTYQGVYVNILELVAQESGLHFQFLSNEGGQYAWEAVKNKKADVWGSASLSTQARTQGNLQYTSFYYHCSYSLVGKKEKNINLSDTLRIAIPLQEESMRELIEKQYPQWVIGAYDNIEDCLSSVKNAETDLAALNSIFMSTQEESIRNDFVVIEGNDMYLPICMGVSQDSDPRLVSVLNKAILKIDRNELESSVFNSITSIKEKVTLKSLVEKNPLYAVMIITIILIILLIGILLLYRNWTQEKQNRILQDKTKELEEALVLQEKLRNEAQTDVLTGLKNKGISESECRSYLENGSGQKHALFILDIDNFKQINDTHGHLFGDEVLKKFAHILLQHAQQQDVVARIGGDEFLVFVPNIEHLDTVLRRVDAFYKEMEALTELPISCSIGIAVSQIPHKRYDELFFEADKTLYEAKRKGKNQYALVICASDF